MSPIKKTVFLSGIAVIIVLFLSSCASASKEIAFPKPQGYINDYAGILDAATKNELDALVRSVESSTSAEIAVAVVESAQGLTVQQYANALFAEWGVGKAGQDNGILMLVALEDRELWIEVGYGLEGVVTDLEAGVIVDDVILPFFREGEFSMGIYYGVAAIANKIYLESGMAGLDISSLKSIDSFSPQASAPASTAGGPNLFLLVCLPFFGIIFIIIIIASIFSRRCPKCKKFTLKTTYRTLLAATYSTPGSQLVIRECRNCGFREEKTKKIPRKSRTTSTWGGSSGGSSGGGGFGGGRSGGGGAGGRW
jgi:uncharacterized protein